MSLSSSQLSSYPSRVQAILRCLQQGYGDEAARLALQALEALNETLSPSPTAAPPALSQKTQLLLRNAYDASYQRAGTEWVHHAMLYAAVQTLDPSFTYKPDFKTWPRFLLAYPRLFESQILHEQLHVRVIFPQEPRQKSQQKKKRP